MLRFFRRKQVQHPPARYWPDLPQMQDLAPEPMPAALDDGRDVEQEAPETETPDGRSDGEAATAPPPDDVVPALAESVVDGWAALAKQQPDMAAAAFEAAISANPNTISLWYGLALARRELGANDEALRALRQALLIEPGFATAHTLMGSMFAKAGDLPGAEEAFRAAIQHDPSTVPARIHLADLLTATQRREEGLLLVQEAAALAPGDAAVYTHLGHLRATAGQRDAAREAFETAITIDGTRVAARAGLANVLAQLGQPAAAVEQARIAAGLAPQDSRVQLTFGFLLLVNGEPHAAAAAYAQAAALDPGYGDAHSGWATALEQAGDLDGAVRQAEAGANLVPEDAGLQAKLGALLAKRGDAAGAGAAFQRELALNPSAPSDGLRIYDTYSYLLDHPEHQNLANVRREFEYSSPEFSKADYEQSRGVIFDDYGDAYRDWVRFGRSEGLGYSPGKNTMLKIILKAKDEPELIVKWIEHHAGIVGYHNLIVLDCGSTDPNFLRAISNYFGKILILKYDHYYDTVHSSELNFHFYNFLSNNCKYLTVLDADEFIFGYDEDTISGPNAVRLLSGGNAAVYAGTWFPNIAPPQSVGAIIDWTQPIAFSLEHQDLELGTLAGKAIVRSDLATKVKHIGHNLHVKEVMAHFTPASFGKVGILHLSRLGADINRARALKHLYAKNVIPHGLPSEQIETLLKLGLDNETYPGITAHYAKIYLGLANGPRMAHRYFQTSMLFDNRTEVNETFSAAFGSFDFDAVVALAERRQVGS